MLFIRFYFFTKTCISFIPEAIGWMLNPGPVSTLTGIDRYIQGYRDTGIPGYRVQGMKK